MEIQTADYRNLSGVVDLLEKGGVIVYPTETVYGLGALADNPSAIERIARLKGSDPNSPFLILIRRIDDLLDYARHVPPLALKLTEHFWPGPLTLILPVRRSADLHPRLVGPSGGVALRVSSHPWCRALMDLLGRGLVSTSVNPTGLAAPCSLHPPAGGLDDRLLQGVDLVLDGGRLTGIVSTVLDFCLDPPLIRRVGAIDRATIESVIPSVRIRKAEKGASIACVKRSSSIL